MAEFDPIEFFGIGLGRDIAIARHARTRSQTPINLPSPSCVHASLDKRQAIIRLLFLRQVLTSLLCQHPTMDLAYSNPAECLHQSSKVAVTPIRRHHTGGLSFRTNLWPPNLISCLSRRLRRLKLDA